MQRSEHPKALLSWSSGKDSAYALSVLRENDAMDVVALVTTIDRRTRRVPVHFVRESVLDLQAQAIGLPVWKIEVDATFLDQLPQSVDPCGENGEFHTVVCGGPGFVRPLRLRVGHRVDDGSFVVVDAQPATSVQGG